MTSERATRIERKKERERERESRCNTQGSCPATSVQAGSGEKATNTTIPAERDAAVIYISSIEVYTSSGAINGTCKAPALIRTRWRCRRRIRGRFPPLLPIRPLPKFICFESKPHAYSARQPAINDPCYGLQCEQKHESACFVTVGREARKKVGNGSTLSDSLSAHTSPSIYTGRFFNRVCRLFARRGTGTETISRH